MKLPLFTLVIAFAARSTFAECDCTITPFQPPSCAKECMAKIAAKATYGELTGLLHIEASVSKKIIDFPERASATSIEAYRGVLSDSELATYKAKVGNANPKVLTTILHEDKKKDKTSQTHGP
jgi:hypothetical protein